MVKDWIPISHDNYKQVQGPFYHGTKANLAIGDLLTTGFISHFEDGRILKHIYFSALMEPAVWGAELAMSLSGLEGRGYIYIVEPTGPFEDDPNLTNKRWHCCKVSDEAAFCLIQRPYISKTLLT
ncbi:NAD(+)--rifampin ADP-ribosyltransferase, partial [Salmonella enterica subsp. enterica serovar 1,4,[5],12:i:-]